MVVLALDTTTRAGSIAIFRDPDVRVELAGDPARTHGERLPGDVDAALARARLTMADVELLAVNVGPGSFTGLRIGIATMQGLAFGREVRIVPVSGFEALVEHPVARDAAEALIAPWIDAQRGEVYSALYDRGSRAVLVPPQSATPAATLEAWKEVAAGRPVLFLGDGAVRYRDVILGEGSLAPRTVRVLDAVPPTAASIAAIAARAPERGVLPHAVVPLYVRRPDAELARDRRQQTPTPNASA